MTVLQQKSIVNGNLYPLYFTEYFMTVSVRLQPSLLQATFVAWYASSYSETILCRNIFKIDQALQ